VTPISDQLLIVFVISFCLTASALFIAQISQGFQSIGPSKFIQRSEVRAVRGQRSLLIFAQDHG